MMNSILGFAIVILIFALAVSMFFQERMSVKSSFSDFRFLSLPFHIQRT